MNDFRRHRAWCPRGRPAGQRRLDVATDNGAFPVWTWFNLPYPPFREVHGCAGPGHLGISADLAAELQSWSTWHDAHVEAAWRSEPPPPSTEGDWRDWKARGRLLAQRLAEETGDQVVYLWPSEGRDATCPDCGPKE